MSSDTHRQATEASCTVGQSRARSGNGKATTRRAPRRGATAERGIEWNRYGFALHSIEPKSDGKAKSRRARQRICHAQNSRAMERRRPEEPGNGYAPQSKATELHSHVTQCTDKKNILKRSKKQ